MKKVLTVALGILTATGGFIDAGAIATSAAAGAQFGLGLVWAMLLATFAVIMLVEMSGRLAAVSGKTYAFRVRALGPNGLGPWSDVAVKMAP